MNISAYSDLIKNLPVEKHCITTKYKTWENAFGINPPGEIKQIFNDREEIIIAREEILNETNIKKKIYMTILWGYPKGMRNNYHQNIFSQIEKIEGILRDSTRIDDWNEHITNFTTIHGLGLSTYSKLLYFNKSLITDYKAIILDKRIIKCINGSIFDCFETLNFNSDIKAKNNYPEYLKIVKSISEQNNVIEDQIEFFLFLFGNNIKGNS